MKGLCKNCIVYACCEEKCEIIHEYLEKMSKIISILFIIISIISISAVLYFTRNIEYQFWYLFIFWWMCNIVNYSFTLELYNISDWKDFIMFMIFSPFVVGFSVGALIARPFVLRNIKPELIK